MGIKDLQTGGEWIEPELLSRGGPEPRAEEPYFFGAKTEKPGLLTRLKLLAAGGLALLGIGLFLSGALLTSTVIGAIIGVPLLLAGAIVFFLLFKLLSFGAKNRIVFHRF